MDMTRELYQLWANQLHREFASICFQYSLTLKPPVMVISDAETICGSWEAAARRISISSKIIQSCDWNIVVDVLKHEMAHQICAEVFGREQSQHSELFRKACTQLGLSAQYHKPTLDITSLHLTGQRRDDFGSRDIIRKIKKLLALTRSSNEHEAQLAMTKAKILIDRHNITENEARSEEGVGFQIVKLHRKRVTGYQKRIAALLSQYFYVRLIQASCYDPLVDSRFRTFEVYGNKSNVDVAVHCFAFLEGRLHQLWKNFSRDLHQKNIRTRNSYMYGVLHGVGEVLAQKERERYYTAASETGIKMLDRHTTAVTLVSEQEIERCMRKRYPKIQTRRSSTTAIQPDTYQLGIQAGKRITINDAVSEHGTTRRLLLTQ